MGEYFRIIDIAIYEAASWRHIYCRVGTLANAVSLLWNNEVWTGNGRSRRVSRMLKYNLLILSHTYVCVTTFSGIERKNIEVYVSFRLETEN